MYCTIQASESESSSLSECHRLCRAKDWSSLLVRVAELLQLNEEQSTGHVIIHDNIYHGKVASIGTCEELSSSCSSNANDNTAISTERRSSLLLNHHAKEVTTGILSQAVRAGAPLFVLETLLQLDPQQVYHVVTTTESSSSLSYKSCKIATRTSVLQQQHYAHEESIQLASSKNKNCPRRRSSTSVDDAGGIYEPTAGAGAGAGAGLPCGITILHDAVRYHSLGSSRSRSNGSRFEEHHYQDDDDHCGWKILEFLVERILQQQQLEDTEPATNTKTQQESSSSWLVGNDSKPDRYTCTTMPDDSYHNLDTHSSNSSSKNNNLFAIQDTLGRTALHYLVEQQLWQIQILLSSSSATTDTSFHDEDDATDFDGLEGEQCSRSSLLPSISRILEASWRAFEKMISANPSVMQIMDSDGNTPLVLLLAASSTHHVAAAAATSSTSIQQRHDIVEAEIFRRVQLMLTLCPAQVAVSRKVPSTRKAVSWSATQWKQQRHRQPPHQEHLSAFVTTENNISCTNSSTSVLTCPSCASTSSISATCPTNFPVYGLPLYHALLYGRCPETILELLRAQRCIGFNGCSVVVTHYAEYCLHVAVTRRAPLAVLQAIVDEYPDATLAPDVHGLTPLEWLWMSHVMDWHQATTMHRQQQQQQQPEDHENADNEPNERAFSLLSPSRRRFLHRDYLEWYNDILDHHCTPYTADRYDFMDTKTGRSMQNELLQRMKILLPRAATEFGVTTVGPWHNQGSVSLVHAACRLCGFIPRGMLQMVLAMDPDAKVQLRSPDDLGWYPLHYAAATPFTGYSASLPLGTIRSRGTSLLQEESPVALVLTNFPAASRATDIIGQLPLHVAIDAAKEQVHDDYMEQYQHSSASNGAARAATVVPPSTAISHEREIAVLDLLLSHWPESIRQRDGKTGLFPWQQAAVGHGASLQTIYTLLRRDPTCVLRSIV
jgi:hypothetical protein